MQHNACCTASVLTSDCSLVAMWPMHLRYSFAAAVNDNGKLLQIWWPAGMRLSHQSESCETLNL